MNDKADKTQSAGKPEKSGWSGRAAIAGAAIGSAAIAAAMLYASRRKDKSERKAPPHPTDAPETD